MVRAALRGCPFSCATHGDHVGDGCGPPRVIFGEVTGEGRGLTLGGVVLTVNGDRDVVERQLGTGSWRARRAAGCSGAGGTRSRARCGSGRGRRAGDAAAVEVPACRATHVLLPARLLSRRADAGAVIGRALEEKAAGRRPEDRGLLGRPESTVRGWLRALARTRAGPGAVHVAGGVPGDRSASSGPGRVAAGGRGRGGRGGCRGRCDAAGVGAVARWSWHRR